MMDETKTEQILRLCSDLGSPRALVVPAYAVLIAEQASDTDWSEINGAIIKRWSPHALDWIKKRAWAILGDPISENL